MKKLIISSVAVGIIGISVLVAGCGQTVTTGPAAAAQQANNDIDYAVLRKVAAQYPASNQETIVTAPDGQRVIQNSFSGSLVNLDGSPYVPMITQDTFPEIPSNTPEQPYSFKTIDYPGANVTQPYGINAGGDIVGTYIVPGSTKNRGFALINGAFSAVNFPGSDYTYATAIGPAGDIAGYYGLIGGAATSGLGFLRDKYGGWTTLANSITPEPTMTPSPFRLLPDGTMVGCFHYATSTGAYTTMHGFIKEPNGPTIRFDYPSDKPFAMHYSATPNGKTIVGVYMVGSVNHGYMLKGDEFIPFDVPGSAITIPQDISPSGRVIVGMYRKAGETPASVRHGFIADTNGSSDPANWTFTDLDVPGATITRPRGMNAAGDIVGDYVLGGVNHGFVASRTGR